MKYLVVILLFVTTANAQSRFIETNKVDEFTGKRIIQTISVELEIEQSGREPLLAHNGFVVYEDGLWACVLGFGSKTWAFLGEREAHFLVDGTRSTRALSNVERIAEGGYVIHVLAVRLDKSFLRMLEHARSVRVKIGHYIFDMTEVVDEEISAVKQIIH